MLPACHSSGPNPPSATARNAVISPSNLIDLIFPQQCLLCGDHGQHGRAICGGCEDDLPRPEANCSRCALPLPAPGLCGRCLRHPPPYWRASVPLQYGPPLDALLLQLKFGGRLAVAPLLGKLLADAIAAEAGDELVVPIPLHRHRLAQRGFNQATEIGRVLARQLGLQLAPSALRRVRETRPQSTVGARDRRRLMKGVFVAPTTMMAGRRVALLDDVVTTGATVESATLAALSAGAAAVKVWAVARTPPHTLGSR